MYICVCVFYFSFSVFHTPVSFLFKIKNQVKNIRELDLVVIENGALAKSGVSPMYFKCLLTLQYHYSQVHSYILSLNLWIQ